MSSVSVRAAGVHSFTNLRSRNVPHQDP